MIADGRKYKYIGPDDYQFLNGCDLRLEKNKLYQCVYVGYNGHVSSPHVLVSYLGEPVALFVSDDEYKYFEEVKNEL